MHTVEGILLSYIRYGDHDAVLHCYTAENGFQSFFVKGIYTARNKKKPYLYPLNVLQITLSKASADSQIQRISRLDQTQDHFGFDDVSMHAVLFFTADFLHQVLREESRNPQLFSAIKELRKAVAVRDFDAHLRFIHTFLRLTGVAPQGSGSYLNPETGLFESSVSHVVFDDQISAVWKELGSDHSENVRIKRQHRQAFLDSLMTYCQYHLDGFYIPQSLAVVRQIFE